MATTTFVRFLSGLTLLLGALPVLAGSHELMLEGAAGADPDAVKTLLARGVDPDLSDPDGNTALIIAAREGGIEVVRALLAARPRLNATNRFGETALMLAAYSGRTEVVRELLLEGADVNHGRGWNPLLYAVFRGHGDIADLLLKFRADPNSRGPNGSTALMFAARSGQADIISMLLAHGADPHASNADGQTALTWAIDAGNTDAARVLQAVEPTAGGVP